MSLLPVTSEDVNEITEVAQSGATYLKENFMRIIIAVIVVVVLFKLTNKLTEILERKIKLKQVKKNKTLAAVIAKAINIIIKIIILAGFFQFIGVPTSFIVTVAFGAILVVAFGLKDFMSNVGASVILSFSKILHIGEYIEALGVEGTVLENQLLHTSVLTPDNKIVFLPNNKLVSDKIVTYDRRKTRRVDIDVYVSYDNDLRKVSETMMKTMKLNKFVLEDPKPYTIVRELDKFYVHMQARCYVKTKDFWQVEWSLPLDIKEDLSDAGVKFLKAPIIDSD